MNKAWQNYIVDVLLFFAFLVTAITGIVIFFVLPSQVRGGGFYEFMGMTKLIWKDIHNYAGLVMTGLVLVHLVLHWNWIKAMTKKVFTRKGKDLSIPKNSSEHAESTSPDFGRMGDQEFKKEERNQDGKNA